MSSYLQNATNTFPENILKAQKLVNIDRDDFEQYVCCPKCIAIYTYEECITTVQSNITPKLCLSCEYPQHSRPSLRKPFGSNLLKVVASKRTFYKPIKVYCYTLIKSSLQSIVSHPVLIETWRERW